MRKQRRYRYREPVFSRGFTIFLILLAVAAGGVALVYILSTYPRIADTSIRPPAGYEDAIDNGLYAPSYTPRPYNNDTNEGEQEATNSPEHNSNNDNPITLATPVPEPYEPGLVTLTVVDNSRLPWYLKLVNRYNFLDYYFMPHLNPIGGGHYFDARAYQALLDMLDSARSDGLSPVVVSSFRSVARQTTLFNNRIQRFIDEDGYDFDDAFEAARRIVAYPGTSEHNLGLAVDIVSNSYHGLTAQQANTPEGIWLAENSYRYGFVLRYPNDKQHITNIIFEPWHFRYVGVYAATQMFERGLVLEEYVSELLTMR